MAFGHILHVVIYDKNYKIFGQKVRLAHTLFIKRTALYVIKDDTS